MLLRVRTQRSSPKDTTINCMRKYNTEIKGKRGEILPPPGAKDMPEMFVLCPTRPEKDGRERLAKPCRKDMTENPKDEAIGRKSKRRTEQHQAQANESAESSTQLTLSPRQGRRWTVSPSTSLLGQSAVKVLRNAICRSQMARSMRRNWVEAAISPHTKTKKRAYLFF